MYLFDRFRYEIIYSKTKIQFLTISTKIAMIYFGFETERTNSIIIDYFYIEMKTFIVIWFKQISVFVCHHILTTVMRLAARVMPV